MPRSHGTHRALPAYDLAVRAAAGDPALQGREDLRPLVAKIQHYKQAARFPEFCADHLRIRTKQAELVPFVLNRAQRFVFEQKIRPALEAGRPLWLYLLKARQLGWTTMIQALAYWRSALWPNVHAFTGAHEEKSVRKIFEISKLFYKLGDPGFRPTEKISNRLELHFANPSDVGDLGLESFMTVAPATSENLGASQTLQVAHLSEFALYDQRSIDVPAMMATFFQTIADAPGTLVILETTARQGYGKELWEDATSRLERLFVSWIADEKYRDPVPLDPDQLQGHGSKYGDESAARSAITEELKAWYPEHAGDEAWYRHESLCRLRWRRGKIDEIAKGGGLALFRREYPLSPDEAFATATSHVFDAEALERARDAARIALVSTPPALHRWDRSKPARAKDVHGVPERFPRIPLQVQLDAPGGVEDLDGLLVYERPRASARYVLAGDPGGGHRDGDPSAIAIWRIVGPRAIKQAAVFRSRVGALELSQVADELGRWYGNAFAIPEATGLGAGFVDGLVHQLGYPNVFRRQVWDEAARESTEKVGFATNASTKPHAISVLQDAIKEGRAEVVDLGTIKELLAYTAEERGRSQVFAAPRGQHDDLVMVSALAAFAVDHAPQAQPKKQKPHRWWKDPHVVAGRIVGSTLRDAPASMFG